MQLKLVIVFVIINEMKKICWWTGTDALTLIKNPPGNKIWHIKLIFYRIKWKIIKNFFDEHWVNHLRLIRYLNKFGVDVSKIKETDLLYPVNYGKEKHKGFNILYYCPSRPANLGGIKFLHWIYGYDIYLKLKEHFKNLNFIRVTGKDDMSKIYPIIDLYIRPTRHDGLPRISRECKVNNIPVIEGENFNPTFKYFKTKINEIMDDKKTK